MLKEKLNNEQRGITSSLDNSLRMRLLGPFSPEALQVSCELRTDSTSSSVTVVSSTQLVVGGVQSGSTTLLSSRKDLLEKRSFKPQAFS